MSNWKGKAAAAVGAFALFGTVATVVAKSDELPSPYAGSANSSRYLDQEDISDAPAAFRGCERNGGNGAYIPADTRREAECVYGVRDFGDVVIIGDDSRNATALRGRTVRVCDSDSNERDCMDAIW